ncbi:MAG TPA: Asp23/Gls24 family envelope stress response protein [Gaiellaceae bacterium]|nr:Asp23/Gls24 family envelope stress response protein [Gaiellaceae bacterium]
MANQQLSIPSELGTITISAGAVADLVARVAARCYGVVGLASKNPVGRMLGRERSAIGVSQDGAGVRIGLRVVVEYGLNLAEVAATLRSQVTYELERLTGLPVAAVDVHIENARRSA